jgi:hypothetical protein
MVRRPYFAGALLLGCGFAAGPAHAQGKPVTFSKDVLPILQKKCANCHGSGNSAGLKVDSFDGIIQGSMNGQVVVAGNPDQSKLFQMVSTRKMPPQGQKLTPAELAVVRSWILAGAKNEEGGGAAAAEKPLAIVEPKDGAEVKEKVRIAVPRTSIPPEGFVAVYIDGRFKLALAPPSPEELDEMKKASEKTKKPMDPNVAYVWDTKEALAEDRSLAKDDRIVKDGPHLIEVRSYKADGEEAERSRLQVNVKNSIESATNAPIRLWYNAGPVGQQYLLEHTVDLQATAGQAGFGGGAAGQQAVGGDKITHHESTKYLVSMEDLMPATGVGFWRERRETPIVITVNGLKQIVRLDTTSRYYSMTKRGDVVRSKVMERESRVPILNPIDLPGRPQRANEPFTTNLRINLGAYIPGSLNIDRVEATIQGKEWQHGEECAKILLSYLAGNAKLNIKSVNISNANFEVEQGTTTVWFSERTNRVIRAETELSGNLVVDISQVGAGGGSGGYPGGGGGDFGVEGAGPLPGGGYPGGSFGAPFSPGGGAGYPGGSFGAAPGGSFGGGGYPGRGGMGGGYPGGGSSGASAAAGNFGATGYPGGGGGYPGVGGMGGGGTGIAPTTKRYFVRLKVKTEISDDQPSRSVASAG